MVEVKMVDVAVGHRWKRNHDGALARIMAIAEGYVLMRFKGCIPFTLSVKDLVSSYTFEFAGKKSWPQFAPGSTKHGGQRADVHEDAPAA